ncbi:ABC-type metal ion transport system, periplasmic component/surface adhesin [Planctomycetales bacterium 10988]|nr:ABC-type metal ion transport system, periplasmic component/surface adhesin [Planctomycetales bacterium 10988]
MKSWIIAGFSLFYCLGMVLPVAAQESGKKKVLVCSTTQVADFARQVVGDDMEVLSILAPGQDPHLYEIRPQDNGKVAKADLCFDNGLHLEGKDWMKTLAANAEKPLITCTAGIQPLRVEEEDGQKTVTVDDPHAWFSPINASIYVKNILNGVVKIDPEKASIYRLRTQLYLQQLRTLHQWINVTVSEIPPSQRILVTSHDAFNYFCDAYGFKAAAPVGWSTGSEIGGGITPERRQMVVRSIQQSGVRAVFLETSVGPRVIREIAQEAGVKIGGTLYADSMGVPGSAGETYLGMMRENVLTIVVGLK